MIRCMISVGLWCAGESIDAHRVGIVKNARTWLTAAAVLLAAGVLVRTEARADTVADFYRGKDLTLIVGYWPRRRLRRVRAAPRHAILANTSPAIRTSSCRTCRAPAVCVAANYLYNVAPKRWH